MSWFLISPENYNNLDWNHLVFGQKIKISENKYKQYIYWDNKEIYIRLPRVRLIYNNFSNKKYNQICIPIYPLWNDTKSFIKMIKELEEIIENTFPKYKLISIIKKISSFKTIKFFLPEIVKITSSDKKNITFNDFKNNSEIEMVLKLSNLWTSHENEKNKIGLTSELYQIKYFPPPSILDINFIDFDEKPIIKKNISVPPPINHLEIYGFKEDEISSEKETLRFIPPTASELKNALTKLKSTK